MENCYFQGKEICTYDLKDENGYYYEDKVLEWKEAAAQRRLSCMECGAKVYLAAGPIKEPYFAHYDSEDCSYGSGHETEELKKGKRLLYHLFKRSYPGTTVHARHRMNNGMYSTFFCELSDNKRIAVDYRILNNSLEKFQHRNMFYHENGIRPVYVLGERQNQNLKQFTWYQNLIQNSMGYCLFLNTDKETVTIKKSFSYRIGKERKFSYCKETYGLSEITLDEEGKINCIFPMLCKKIEDKILNEKKQYESLRKSVKELQEQRHELEQRERCRQEQYVMTQTLRDINPTILEKCRTLIQEGNAHLVSKKYYEAIMGEVTKQGDE